MAQTYNLNSIIQQLSFPTTGEDIIRAAEERNFPEDFMKEFRPKIQGQRFESPDDLHSWLASNLTTHMAGLLGGATVHDLIKKAEEAA